MLTLAAVERQHVLHTLISCHGNVHTLQNCSVFRFGACGENYTVMFNRGAMSATKTCTNIILQGAVADKLGHN
jgi:hypothetical protein